MEKQKLLKPLFTTGLAIVGSLLFMGMAHAQDIAAENAVTGFDSENQTNINLDQSREINITNDADVTNDININADTGNNEASFNTGDGLVRTGDARVRADIATDVNRVAVRDFGSGGGLADVRAGNSITGARSDNEVEVDVDNSTQIDVQNDADIDNSFDLNAETGDNEASFNTGDGEILTGDALLEARAATQANLTELDLGGLGFGAGRLDLHNGRTGFDSDNEVDVDLDNNLDVVVENDADIDNDFEADVDTGGNEASCNTFDGSVRSGDARARFGVDTVANLTDLELRGFGSGLADIEAVNDTTGAFSDNEIDIDLDNEKDIELINDADIDNDIDVFAETGDNEASFNTGDGAVRSGDVNFDYEMGSHVNKARLDLFGAGEGAADIAAANHRTGFDSDNEVDVDIDNSSEVDLINDLNIDNDIDLEALTGENEASFNTGNGAVESGDVLGDVHILTEGNNIAYRSEDWASNDVDFVGENSITGAESFNELFADIENEFDFEAVNDTNIDNDFDFSSETGENEASDNTFDGLVRSGSLDFDIDALTNAGTITDGTAGGLDFVSDSSIGPVVVTDPHVSVISNGDVIV